MTALGGAVTGQMWKVYYYASAQMIAMREISGTTGSSTLYYLHSDHPSASLRTGLGSTSLVTNASGGVVSRQSYYAYGAPRNPQGALPTDKTFTGQRNDGLGGLLDFRARHYSSGLGRFISADSIVPGAGNPQALNRYMFVLGNPVRYTDPTGHYTDEQIQLYLKRNYENWERYWEAWQADPYFMWVLHSAGNDYQLSAQHGPGWGMFRDEGASFTFDGPGSLAKYQGNGPYTLLDKQRHKVPDPWIGEAGTGVGHSAISNYSRQVVYQPQYDYSTGVPVFTGKWRQLGYEKRFSRFDVVAPILTLVLSAGDAYATGGKLILRNAWGGPLTVAWMIDNMVITEDVLVDRTIAEPADRSQAYSNQFASCNLNLGYPCPPR